MEYLRSNHDFLLEEINKIPGLKMYPQEATYLAWIDYSGLRIKDFSACLEKYGVGVIEASVFMGENHIRLNFGTQRHVLEEAVRRIRTAAESLI
ncbi:Cystathionine beta-lyase [compost metagenome]